MTSASDLYIICQSTPGRLQAVEAVAEHVQRHQVSALVVDPVLVATSGDSLAGSEVAQALKTHLFPLATVITPNLPEASALLGGQRVDDLDSMKQVRHPLLCFCLALPPLLLRLWSWTCDHGDVSVVQILPEMLDR